MNNTKLKVAIIGPFPPPYGGIAVHIKRMKHYLENNGIECTVYYDNRIRKCVKTTTVKSIRSYKRFIFSIPFLKFKILHFHTNNYRLKMVVGWYKFLGKKTILTIHGESLHNQLARANFMGRNLLLFSLKKLDKIICVNPKTKEELLDLGFNAKKISVIPAFISPSLDELEVKKLPEFFHENRQKHKFLITANAFQLSFYQNQDLYGIDQSIEVMKRLVNNNYKNVGFIFVISDIADYDYFNKMQELVKKYHLEDHFYFYTRFINYPAVINMCDLFIRPTNTDGDSISVREAMSLKRPVIASNVCKRPRGVVIYKNRSIDDLYLKIIDVIDNYDNYRAKIKNIRIDDNAVKLLKLYEEFFIEK